MKPKRIQLSRSKGWRMPPDTVKVDRSTKWGNPLVVGRDGNRETCVNLHRLLLSGFICVSTKASDSEMMRYRDVVREHIGELRGKNLACWCPLDKPCHADVLLEIANQPSEGAA